MVLNPILNLIYCILRYSGIANLIRKIFARRNITIVVYHNPEEDTFRKHMNYLSERFNFISLSDLIEFYYSDKPFPMPEYALLITFDDGWKENHKLINTITEYKFRPVIFLSSHLINTNRNFWFTNCNPAETKRLKRMSTTQRLNILLNGYNYYPEKEFPENRQVLNLNELRKLKEIADIGSHTCFHPILTKCNFQEKSNEIKGSVERLEELLGMPVTSFAYPNGDYDQKTIEILKAGNIKIARTTDAGWNNRKSDPYRLKVTGVSDNATVSKLAFEITGISRYFQHLLNGSFNGIKPMI
jgi:peptidoglycan/xylan/chitin deacetylase (PgdA/CDA1 family)